MLYVVLYYTIARSAPATARPRPAAAQPRGAGGSGGQSPQGSRKYSANRMDNVVSSCPITEKTTSEVRNSKKLAAEEFIRAKSEIRWAAASSFQHYMLIASWNRQLPMHSLEQLLRSLDVHCLILDTSMDNHILRSVPFRQER